jgi:hypothetical protein
MDSCIARPTSSRSTLRSSSASRSYNFCSNSSTARSHSSMAQTRTASSSSYLMVLLAQASAEVYNSLASASIFCESRSWLLMAVCSLFSNSSLTSRCYHLASTLAFSIVVRSLSMEAHSSSLHCSSLMPPLSRQSTSCAWVNAQGAVPMASSREISPGALMECPRMPPNSSTMMSSSATAVEGDTSPTGQSRQRDH